MAGIGDKQTLDIFRRHLAIPTVSVADHYQYLASELNSKVRGRRCLYLDTRYWVFLRDAALGRAQKPEHVAILRAVRDRVATGVAICPVSDVAVLELTTQADDETRAATGELWDELSQGIALQTEQDRIRIELEQFLLYPREEDAPRPLRDLVWTRPSLSSD